MDKKGALELSMNTIVIIVIGVTLLALGLVFVRGLFDRLSGQTNLIFDEADAAITQLAAHEGKLTVPTQFEVTRGKQSNLNIYLVNELNEMKTFNVGIEPSSTSSFQNPNLKVDVAANSVTLNPGEEAKIVLGALIPSGSPSGSAAYVIKITVDGQPYAEQGFFIEVK